MKIVLMYRSEHYIDIIDLTPEEEQEYKELIEDEDYCGGEDDWNFIESVLANKGYYLGDSMYDPVFFINDSDDVYIAHNGEKLDFKL